MNEDLFVSWDEVTRDIGGLITKPSGYKIYADGVEVADVSGTSHTLVGFIADITALPSISVSAYNPSGEGERSEAVIPAPPDASVPEKVTGVTATIIPK